MATRRHRIVMKPNLGSAAVKASSTASKSKATSVNVTSESPLPAVKAQYTPAQTEDGQQSLSEAEEKAKQTTSEAEVGQDIPAAAAGVLGKDATAKGTSHGGSDAEKKTFSSSKESKSGAYGHRETVHKHRDRTPVAAEDESSNNAIVTQSSDTELNTQTSFSTTPTVNTQQHKSLIKAAATDIDGDMVRSEDVPDAAESTRPLRDEDGTEATPSEADGSCMSEAMSLEPEDEQGGEADDEAQKKPRRRRSKKQRSEPLPSREKSPDRQKMKMSDLLSWNPQQNFLPKKTKRKISTTKDENRPISPTPSIAASDDQESTNQSASLPAPQVMIGPDGNVVLNTESLLIHTPADDTKSKEIIEEDDDDRYLNTNTYRKHKKTKLWTEIETEKFFLGLSMCGTDFSLLTNLLPHRSRRELKNKFRREERRNRPLIDKALANRQQYDLAPFEKITAEDEKKVKKEIKKKVKKESLAEKKTENTPKKKRGRKRKHSESEDEEDDWGPEYDEEDESDQNDDTTDVRETSKVTGVKRQQAKNTNIKTEVVYPNKPQLHNLTTPSVIEENENVPFVPGYVRPTGSDAHRREMPASGNLQYTDLDQPRMKCRPTKTYSRFGSENAANHPQTTSSAAAPGSSGPSTNPIQVIPGSSQVQIEMEGVRNPVQGVLIPSHIVPQIAPQLGIHGSAAGMQVLLVQEEAESGSMVHVYIIPEGDSSRRPGGNSASPNSHPAFNSPIPSPHPTTPIPSPLPVSPFPDHYSPHPIRSPYPNNPIQSPPPVFSPPPQAPINRHPQSLLTPRPRNPQDSAPGLVQNLFAVPQSTSNSGMEHSMATLSHSSVLNSINSTNQSIRQTSGTNVHPQTVSTSINQIPRPTHPFSIRQSNPSQNIAVVVTAPNRNPTFSSSYSISRSTSDARTCSSENIDTPKPTSFVTAGPVSNVPVNRGTSSENDEDCVIVNSDNPQSQLDTSAMTDV